MEIEQIKNEIKKLGYTIIKETKSDSYIKYSITFFKENGADLFISLNKDNEYYLCKTYDNAPDTKKRYKTVKGLLNFLSK